MNNHGKLLWGKMKVLSVDSSDTTRGGSMVVTVHVPCVLTEPLPVWHSNKRIDRISKIENAALKTLTELLQQRNFPFFEIIQCELYEFGTIECFEYLVKISMTFKYDLSLQFWENLRRLQEKRNEKGN